MSALTAYARTLAAERQIAQPVASVRHVHVSDRPLVFVPLQLAGEANAPLAAIVGSDRGTPTVLTVAEPRDRNQRFAFIADLADVILPYIEGYPLGTREAKNGNLVPVAGDAPQLIVPGPAAVAFTRLLGRSARFRRTDGPYAVPATVPLVGRWLSFYSERPEVPGSSLTLVVTDALASHWATGQSPEEDLNLASILGWIAPPPGMTGAEAALLAEDPVRCPPAGPATDPTFDNEVLEGLIKAVRAARLTGGGSGRIRHALTEELRTQLEPTWERMWQAVDLLRALRPGDHVASRWERDCSAFARYADWARATGLPQPKHDGAVQASRRLWDLEEDQRRFAAERAYDDPLVMAEHRMSGEAFAGTVAAAEPTRVDASGRRRVLRPRITVETGDRVVVEPGTVLTSPARTAQEARVISVEAGERTLVTLELQKGMGQSLTPPPGSVPELGERVCYATFNLGYQRRPEFPPREETPWTHGGPPAPYVPPDENAQEAWS
ncbi:MAG: hypothetical protein J2P25_05335 [Nocardiopsaceae bacterium]|nr:hypothetical protein [Nocardiopsaceae bacterium]